MIDTARYIADRFKEPSSYAGIAGVLALLGFNIEPDLWQGVVAAASGLCGLAAVLLKDAPVPPPE